MITHTLTHPFNGPLSGTTRVSWYQKGKTNQDFTEARDSEWQWHQLGHMQVCTVLRSVFYRPYALPAAQPTASKHWRHCDQLKIKLRLIDWLHVVQSKSLSCNSFRRQFCLLLKVFRVGRRDGKRAQHEAESETAASAADDEGGVVSIFLWEDLLQRRLKLTFCGWNHSYRGWFALNATSGHTEFISSDIVVSFNRICCDEIAFLIFGSLDENCLYVVVVGRVTGGASGLRKPALIIVYGWSQSIRD